MQRRAHAYSLGLGICLAATARPLFAAPASATAPPAAPAAAAPVPAATQTPAKAPPGAAAPSPAATPTAKAPPAVAPAATSPATAAAAPAASPPAESTAPAPAQSPPTSAAPAAEPAAAPSTEPDAGDEPIEHRHRKNRRPGVREHDGFYARFGLGFSGFGDTVASEATTGDSFRDQGLVTGFATVSEIAFGGTLKRGFVLGGGIYGASIETPFVYDGRGRPLPSEFRRPDSFTLVGIMGDFYPNPRRGLHLQAALGFAVLTGLNPGGDLWRDRHAAVGGGAMLGIGYEWWVGEQWSIGVLGRGTAGAMTENDATGARWFHFAGAWPSILFTVTYH